VAVAADIVPAAIPRNIVVCCDGTGNQFGQRNSNVVKLYQTLVRDPSQAVAYYHPGVGTMGAKNALTTAGKAWTQWRGLAFGYGLSENIADAYRCLMHTWQPGDRLYIFGFSRGAYTARALCGLLQMFGLLSPGNDGLIPYALRLFKRRDGRWARWRGEPNKFQLAAGFKKTFSRPCRPHFVGVWDTVSSVGWILDPFTAGTGLPYTHALDDVAIVRHAVAIDERRAFFRQNLVAEPQGRDIRQVWFAGVHSDVGGSYPEPESGLSKIALAWMITQARDAGLRFDSEAVARTLGGDPRFAKPLPAATLHNSLTPGWWIGEIWPKKVLARVPGSDPPRFRGRMRLNLFRRRRMPDAACVHGSVIRRMALVASYRPDNLPTTYRVEPEDPLVVYPRRLSVGERATVGVFARLKWNDTGIALGRGERYRLEASGRWRDATIPAGPDGFASPSWGLRRVERWRRLPGANWFALVGEIRGGAATPFVIGASADLDVETDAVLYCWANDLPFMYWNNSGHTTLTVTRVA
jgi:uncharacterized protein (DUF2235 family)